MLVKCLSEQRVACYYRLPTHFNILSLQRIAAAQKAALLHAMCGRNALIFIRHLV